MKKFNNEIKRLIKEYRAFTLAEVLVVVAIIGIIAVLTIPRVLTNYRNSVFVTQIQKLYGQISVATQSAMNDDVVSNFYESASGRANECDESDATSCTQGPGYFLNKYFKAVKRNCQNDTESCLAATYVTTTGVAVAAVEPDYCIQIKTGATICMEYNSTDKKSYLYVDTNAKSDPNVAGKDLFYMTIEEDGKIGDYKDTDSANCTTAGPAGCLNGLLENDWKMNY